MIRKIREQYTSLSVVAKATLWFTICNVLQRGISLLTTPIFTRLMTTEQYGVVNVFNSWKQILLIICTFCLDYGVFYKGISKFENDKDGYTLSMQTFASMITSVVLAIYLVFRKYINQFTELSTFLTVIMIVETYATFSISFWSLRHKYDQEYKRIVAVTFSMSLANVLLGVIAVLVSQQRDVARILAVALVQCVFGFTIYFVNIRKGKKLYVGDYVKYAVLFNLPLIPHYFASYILEQSDRIMIQKMIGFSEAGIYSVAYNVATTIKIIGNSINNAIIPWEYKKLREKDYKSLNSKFNGFMLIYVVIALLFISFAPEAIYILAGQKYYEAIYCIPPVSASCFFVFVWGVYGNAEFFYDANKFTLYLSCSGAFLNLILNYIFIQAYGYIAAAYTTLFCYIVFAVLHFVFLNHVAKKKTGVAVFDARAFALFSIAIVLASATVSFLYENIVLRYSIVAVVIAILFIKRKSIKSFIVNAQKS